MTDSATDVRLSALEREVSALRATQVGDAELRGELRSFMAEMRERLQQLTSQRSIDQSEHQKRDAELERRVRDLEHFKAKLVGAVAASGLLGGGAGAGVQLLLQSLGGS